MTNKTEWKMAKWVKNHPNAKRKDLPKRFPKDLPGGRYRFFRVECVKSDSEGYQIQDPEDLFKMTDSDLDAYMVERRSRIHAIRDWLEPTGIVIANIIAIAALIVAIVT